MQNDIRTLYIEQVESYQIVTEFERRMKALLD